MLKSSEVSVATGLKKEERLGGEGKGKRSPLEACVHARVPAGQSLRQPRRIKENKGKCGMRKTEIRGRG